MTLKRLLNYQNSKKEESEQKESEQKESEQKNLNKRI